MLIAKTIRILVVAAHAVICSGLTAILCGFPDFEVVGQAKNTQETLYYSDQYQPDIIAMDLLLPDEKNGIEVTRILHFKYPRTHVVVITHVFNEISVRDTLQAGVKSYLLENISVGELERAVRAAYDGQTILSPEVSQMLIRNTRAHHETNLTSRERQVLKLMVRGCGNHEIALQLHITLSTVQFHVSNILSKLGVHNRIEAAAFVMHNSLSEEEL